MPFLIFLYIALWAAVIRLQNLNFTVVNGLDSSAKKRIPECRKNGRKKQRPQSLFHQFIDSRFTENFDAVF